MKFWTLHDIAENVPDELVEVLEPVLVTIEAFRQGGHYPRLIRMGRNESDEECYRYVVEVELAPGVVLPTECGLLELDYEVFEEDHDEGETLARDLQEGLDACLGQMHTIGEVLHDTRVRVRKHMAGWTGAAQASRLIQVQLAPYDHWRGGAPEVRILVEGLDVRLQTEVTEIRIDESYGLEGELEQHRAVFERRVKARSRLARSGATGTIDQLAVNAIAQFADLGETLRRFGSEWRFWLPDDTALLMQDGHVTAGSGSVDPAIEWESSRVHIRGLYLPKPDLLAAVGRPATEVYEHELFSDDMTITEATSEITEGVPWVTLRFDQPKLLFCSDSGRTWKEDEALETPETSEASTVVPFLRRVN